MPRVTEDTILEQARLAIADWKKLASEGKWVNLTLELKSQEGMMFLEKNLRETVKIKSR